MKKLRLSLLVLCASFLLVGCITTQRAQKAEARKKQMELKLALNHYKQGIDAYTNSRYAEAIKHWRVTLEKDPQHEKAGEYIERAESVMKGLGQKVPVAKK